MCQARLRGRPGTSRTARVPLRGGADVSAIGVSVADLAARQHGLVTRNQLRSIGMSPGAIGHWASTGRLHRVHLGVFAVGHRALSDRARLLAAVMACGSGAALSHIHAALLWDLLPPWREVELTPTHVTVPRGSGRGRRPGIVIHRAALPATELRALDRIPICSAARTVLDCAEASSARDFERLVDQAITGDRVTRLELDAMASAHRTRRGAAAIRRLLDAAERFDSVTDSELEEEFIRVVRGAGLPIPALGQRLAGMKVDAMWRAERVVAELDGYRWHRTRFRQDADRQREARVRQLGWIPLRYSATQVFDTPLAVIADLAAVLVARRS